MRNSEDTALSRHGLDKDDEDAKVFVSRKEGTLTLLKARSGALRELKLR